MAEKIKIFEKKYWLHAVIFLVAILPIIYFVPGVVPKTYDFEIGKPWNDQKLLAPKQMTVPMDEKTEMFKRDSSASPLPWCLLHFGQACLKSSTRKC